MGNFAEMFGLGRGPDAADPEDERRRRLLELLKQAGQPEPIAELPVGRQQSFSGNLADHVLAGLADGFVSAGGGHSNYSALDMLQRRREDRQAREDYNLQARAKNESGKKRAGTLAELEIMQQDAAHLDKMDQVAREDAIRREEAAVKIQAAAAKRKIELEDAASERRYGMRLQAAKSGAVLAKDADEDTILNAIATEEKKANDRKAAGKEDEPDYKQVGLGNTIAIEMLTGLPEGEDKAGNVQPATPPLQERLAKGETPEDLLDEFEMALDMNGIYGKERAMAMETWDRRVGAAIRKFQQQKKAAAASAPPPTLTGGGAGGAGPAAIMQLRGLLGR